MPRNTQRILRAGIYGASGTTGTELCTILARHPNVRIAFATSRQYAGMTTRDVDPAAVEVPLIEPDEADLSSVDVVFTCLPHGKSAEWVEHCHHAAGAPDGSRSGGPKVIDLSGDLRLRDADLHQKVYGSPRSEAIVARAVYGMTELAREQIRSADIVSNPGCYPTCVGLALAPAAREGLTSEPVVINALSGVSGAGRSPSPATHFCAVTGDVRPYNLGHLHRHTHEIEQILADSAHTGGPVVFNPHVIPIERGMLATITLRTDADAERIHSLYAGAYEGETFIRLNEPGDAARIRGVVGTNRVMIGVHEGGDGHVVITSAIDNLVKGAAGQAVQNMNLMFDLPETAALTLGSPTTHFESEPLLETTA